MASVHDTRSKIYRSQDLDDEDATEHLETEGERLIKEMVHKQLNTKVSLKDQLQETKEFLSTAEVVPITTYISGQTTLKEFTDCSNRLADIEHLKSCGLTDEEITFIKEYETDKDNFENKYKKVEKSILQNRIQEIKNKIEERIKISETENPASVNSTFSRHEKELTLVEKPDSEVTKLLQFALSCKQTTPDPRPLSHPVHHLQELEQELFGHLKTPKKRKKSKRDKKEDGKFEVESFPEFVYSKNKDGRSSLWDLKHVPQCSSKDKCVDNKKTDIQKVYTCKQETLYTIRNNKIIRLEDLNKNATKQNTSDDLRGESFIVTDLKNIPENIVPLSEIKSSRLSIEQIKELPRFKNYEEGTPSQILYVKNISPNTTESDLVSIFSHFESEGSPRIIYRLLTGRMKGQAFITFPNIEKATEALTTVNGYLWKEKPLIIQYGKKETT